MAAIVPNLLHIHAPITRSAPWKQSSWQWILAAEAWRSSSSFKKLCRWVDLAETRSGSPRAACHRCRRRRGKESAATGRRGSQILRLLVFAAVLVPLAREKKNYRFNQ